LDLEIGDDLYRFRIARTRHERERSYGLMYDIYERTGYAHDHPARMWLTLYELLPDSVTLVVLRDEEVAATLTLVFDSPFGLPDDETYRDELDRMRASGCRLCQIISLGVNVPRRASRRILGRLFDFAYLIARRVRRATHFVHTVIPKHAPFYRDQLLFMDEGEERFQQKTGATVVLLSIPLDTPDWVEGDLRKHTFYRFFLEGAEEREAVEQLEQSIRPPSLEDMHHFLSTKPELWRKACEDQKTYLEDAAGLEAYYSVPVSSSRVAW
jgi:hypothetical protein